MAGVYQELPESDLGTRLRFTHLSQALNAPTFPQAQLIPWRHRWKHCFKTCATHRGNSSSRLVFTLTAVLTLALGIGANTAIFTVVYATLLAPMPYRAGSAGDGVVKDSGRPQRHVRAATSPTGKIKTPSSPDLCAFTGGSFNLATKDQPEYVEGQLTIARHVQDDGREVSLWPRLSSRRGRTGQRPRSDLDEQAVEAAGVGPEDRGQDDADRWIAYTVVGVLAPGVTDRLDQDLVAPLAFKPDQLNHDFHWLLAMGRMKPGVTMQQAQANMDAVTANIAKAYPKSNKGWGAIVDPLKNDFMPKERIQTLWVLLGAVGFVLLIACVNVANLLLAKGTTRQKEVALRAALGASRRNIFGQFLTENLLLALTGGLLGIGVGVVALRGWWQLCRRARCPRRRT